jgi:hypothetical protein
MEKLFNVHPSDDQLDLYLIGHLSLEHRRRIEEHYLWCAKCLDRISSVTDFIAVLKNIQATNPHLLDRYSASVSSRTARNQITDLRRSFFQRNPIGRIAATVLLGTFLFNARSSLRDLPPHQ